MIRPITTPDAPPPFSDYAQAIEAPAGARWLHVSGQVGAAPDGTLLSDARAQHDQVWANIGAILKAADMSFSDIVEIIGIVTSADCVPLFREARDAALGGHRTASTLLIAGLAHPDWKVEIAVRAARVPL